MEPRLTTRFLGSLSIAVLIGLVCSTTEIRAEDRCGGVLMATRTVTMKDRKEMVQKLGFYAIDGGLVMDGKSTCTPLGGCVCRCNPGLPRRWAGGLRGPAGRPGCDRRGRGHLSRT